MWHSFGVLKFLFTAAVISLFLACSAEVGSDRWCNSMKKKEKGDWTANEAVDFAKHCIVK